MTRATQDKFETASLFQQRAHDLRAIAAGLTDDCDRNLLLSLADECERRVKAAQRRLSVVPRTIAESVRLPAAERTALKLAASNSELR